MTKTFEKHYLNKSVWAYASNATGVIRKVYQDGSFGIQLTGTQGRKLFRLHLNQFRIER